MMHTTSGDGPADKRGPVLDISDQTIVAVCPICAWRMVSPTASEVAVRSALYRHLTEHPGAHALWETQRRWLDRRRDTSTDPRGILT